MKKYRFGQWTCDPAALTLGSHDVTIKLEKRVMGVLELLLQKSPEAVSSDEIISEVWSDVIVGDNALHRAIAIIRKSLGDDKRSPKFVESIHRIGYRFLQQVETDSSDKEPLGRLSVCLKLTTDPEAVNQTEMLRTTNRFIGWYSPGLKVLRNALPQTVDYLAEIIVKRDDHGNCIFEWETLQGISEEVVGGGKHREALKDFEDKKTRVFELIGHSVAADIIKHWSAKLRRADRWSNCTYWDRLMIADHYKTMEIGQIDERKELLEQAMEEEPKLSYAFAAYADLLSWKVANGLVDDARGVGTLARNHVQTALELDLGEPYSLAYCGRALSRIGDIDEGVLLCEQAAEMAPSISNLEHLAMTLTFAGEAKRAQEIYQRLHTSMPAGQTFRYGRAAIPLVQLGLFEEARRFAEIATAHRPHEYFVWAMLANILAHLGELDSAHIALSRACEIMPRLSLDDLITGTTRTYARTDAQAQYLTGGFERLKQTNVTHIRSQ